MLYNKMMERPKYVLAFDGTIDSNPFNDALPFEPSNSIHKFHQGLSYNQDVPGPDLKSNMVVLFIWSPN